MPIESMIFSPISILFFLILLTIFFLVIIFLHIGLITIAFERLGLTEIQAFGFLLISLLGSHINIPIKRIEVPTDETFDEQVRFLGVLYNVPKRISKGYMVVAVNFGGAIVPFLLSCYLMVKNEMFLEPIIGALLVAVLTYFFAKPVPGVGIAMPVFIPPIIAALVTLVLGGEQHAPATAYIAATMGTLLGADIFHLKDLPKIHAPMVSIGGAGTFDGIFLAGIIAVILA